MKYLIFYILPGGFYKNFRLVHAIKRMEDKEMKKTMWLWFFFKRKKINIWLDWLMRGTSHKFAFEKAQKAIPYFEKKEDEISFVRERKFKRILK